MASLVSGEVLTPCTSLSTLLIKNLIASGGTLLVRPAASQQGKPVIFSSVQGLSWLASRRLLADFLTLSTSSWQSALDPAGRV